MGRAVTRFEQIRSALETLDHSNDAHWDGAQPCRKYVERLAGFEIGPSELNKFCKFRAEVLPDDEPAPVVKAPLRIAPEDPIAIAQRVAHAEERLIDARAVLQEAKRRAKDARGKLAEAITQWQLGSGAPRNFDELIRQEIAASNELRRAQAAGEIPPPPERIHRSTVDRVASYGIGGSAEDHVRGRMKNGGYRHGAMSISQSRTYRARVEQLKTTLARGGSVPAKGGK
jgi:hypothetical protein